VILAAFWSLWHLPLHLTGYYAQVFGTALNGFLTQTFSTVPLAILFTWLYNRSKGNLLVMVLLHTAVNVTSGIVAPAIGMYVVTAIAVASLIVFDRMYRRLPEGNLRSPTLSTGCTSARANGLRER
jgi:membrane protease YdiL (CAAX protease family)